ncbi:MAG: hypothetical protein H8E44_12815 [Planctomycetes bacterium]|nr:hypothetical protein [Planctomycetota bacterium]MBL7037788.1 hypothetical protein [Pirellulaceae bacterium]
MKQRNATTVLILLAAALLTIKIDAYSAAAQDRAPREVFLSETRLDTLKRRIEQRTEPTYSAWLDLKSRAEGLLDRQHHAPEHWYVPGYYRDATGHSQAKRGLQDGTCTTGVLPKATRFAKRSSRWQAGPAILHRSHTGTATKTNCVA